MSVTILRESFSRYVIRTVIESSVRLGKKPLEISSRSAVLESLYEGAKPLFGLILVTDLVIKMFLRKLRLMLKNYNLKDFPK